MEFKEIDQQFYETKMKDKIVVEKKLKFQRMLFIISLLVMLICGCMNYYVPFTKGNMAIILLLAISMPATLCTAVYWYGANKEMKPYWKIMNFYKQPDQVIVYPDFHIEVIQHNGNKTSMDNIQSVKRNNHIGVMMVEYKYRSNDMNYSTSYEFSYCMKDLVKIEKLLNFKMELQKARAFVNNSMNKIFQMEPTLRNRLFVEEINSGQLLIPIRLLDDYESSETCLILFDTILVGYEVDEKGFVCMYTSMKEVSKNTLQQFPQCINIDIKRMFMILKQQHSSVFKEKEFGLIINKNNEKVQLQNNQLEKILKFETSYGATGLYERV